MLKRQKEGESMGTPAQVEAVIALLTAAHPDQPTSSWDLLREVMDDGLRSIDQPTGRVRTFAASSVQPERGQPAVGEAGRAREVPRMRFRVEVICVNDGGAEERREVMEMERRELAMETLGLSLAEGKAILQGVQDFVASQQISGDLQGRRSCPNCGQRYHSKEAGTSRVETVFGPVTVPNPRSCQREGPKTFRPTATWLTGKHQS